MNGQRVSINLSSASNASRPIKTVALAVFTAVRWVGREAAKTPDRIACVKQDVAEAWKESERC